jgi:signal transduction histidine kinase
LNFVIEDFSDLLKKSLEGANRIGRIVADLKALSRIDHLDEQNTDLNEVIR